jgi:spectinomycin phosphotransferase
VVSGTGTELVDRLPWWVRHDFGIELTSVDGVDHGGDHAADLWRATATDGRRYAVKMSGGGTPAGLVVSAHLAEQGVPGVVRPVPTRDGSLWSERAGRRLSVAPWVSDDRALGGGLDASHWVSFGELLARVHATTVPHGLTELLPRESHTHERVAATVRAVDKRVLTVDHSDDLARALADEWRGAARELMTLLDQADVLAHELGRRPACDVLCHGDPHLGNILVGRVGEIWLIDWDDAVLAPRERDLMFALGGVLAFAPVSPQEQESFFDGYGSVGLDAVRLAYYRCTRALVDVADPAVQVLGAGGDAERTSALAIVRGVLSNTGLVRLALSSLRSLGLTQLG